MNKKEYLTLITNSGNSAIPPQIAPITLFTTDFSSEDLFEDQNDCF